MLTGVDELVLYPDVIGGGTECESTYAWFEEQHVNPDSTELVAPDICWEYTDSATVSVHMKYAFTTETPHPGWHSLKLFHLDRSCELPPPGASFVLLDSVLTLADTIGTGSQEDPLIQHSLYSDDVTLPASPGCAFVVLHHDESSPSGGSGHHAYARLLTKLDRPESLSASFNGSSVNLT